MPSSLIGLRHFTRKVFVFINDQLSVKNGLESINIATKTFYKQLVVIDQKLRS